MEVYHFKAGVENLVQDYSEYFWIEIIQISPVSG